MTVPPSLRGFPQEESSFIYRRNGRAFSSLTGRAGGLLNSLVIIAIPNG
jgi:hypothetical protein